MSIDGSAGAAKFSARSKLTGIVMKKGKGAGLSSHLHGRSVIPVARRGVTRLSRTMGFIELSQLPGASGSMDASADHDPESPETALTAQ